MAGYTFKSRLTIEGIKQHAKAQGKDYRGYMQLLISAGLADDRKPRADVLIREMEKEVERIF